MLPMHSTTTLSGVGSCKSVGYETPLRQPGTERPTASKFQLFRRASWILAGSSSAGRSFVSSLQSMTIPTATVRPIQRVVEVVTVRQKNLPLVPLMSWLQLLNHVIHLK